MFPARHHILNTLVLALYKRWIFSGVQVHFGAIISDLLSLYVFAGTLLPHPLPPKIQSLISKVKWNEDSTIVVWCYGNWTVGKNVPQISLLCNVHC